MNRLLHISLRVLSFFQLLTVHSPRFTVFSCILRLLSANSAHHLCRFRAFFSRAHDPIVHACRARCLAHVWFHLHCTEFFLGCIYSEDSLDHLVPPLAHGQTCPTCARPTYSAPRCRCADSLTQCRFCRYCHPTTTHKVLSRVRLHQ